MKESGRKKESLILVIKRPLKRGCLLVSPLVFSQPPPLPPPPPPHYRLP